MKDGAQNTQATLVSLTYFVLFCGVFSFTYLPRYFVSVGWQASEIGNAISVMIIVRSVGMLLWARYADRTGRLAQTIKWLTGIGCVFIAFLPFVVTTIPVYAVLLAQGATVGAIVPLLDTYATKVSSPSEFPNLRRWGSVGFGATAVAVAIIAAVFELDHESVAGIAPWALLVIDVVTLGVVFGFTQTRSVPITKNAKEASIGPDVSSPSALGLVSLLLGLLLWTVHWATHNPYNLYFVFLCEEKGFPAWAPGAGVAAAIVGEVITLTWMARSNWNHRWILPIAAGLAAARWFISAGSTSVWLIIAVQATHGITFGAFLLATMRVLDRHIPSSHRGTGQAVLYVFVFGVGSSMGSSAAGYGVEMFGASDTYAVAGWTSLIVSVLFIVWSKKAK